MHACSILTANFLSFARVLVESYRKEHPHGSFTVLLLDRPPKHIDLTLEKFDVIFADDIGIPHLEILRIRYTAYELSMALRPFFLLHLLKNTTIDTLCFFDADLFIKSSLRHIDTLLCEHNMIICPSFLSPIPDDGCIPSDKEILAAGTLNGGFLAMKNSEITKKTLEWLWERLQLYSYFRPEEGMFGDQKWLDFLPSISKNTLILRDVRFNVSHWNLHERTVTKEGDQYLVQGAPLALYHFSGFRYHEPDVLSAHQNRFDLKNFPALKSLCQEYRLKLKEHGYEETSTWPYAYDAFENGVRITPPIRRVFEFIGATKFPSNPFETGPKSFYEWLLKPCRKNGLNNLEYTLYLLSPEAHRFSHDLQENTLEAFSKWLLYDRKNELPLDPVFTENLRKKGWGQQPFSENLQRLVRRRHTSEVYQWLSQTTKKIIGKKLFYFLKPKSDPMFPSKIRWKHVDEISEKGVTMIGSLQSDSGVGIGARQHLHALRTVGVPCSGEDSRTSPGRQKNINDGGSKKYGTTILECGMDELALVLSMQKFPRGPSYRTIGYITWETEVLPEKYIPMLQSFDEIWCPSSFTTNILTPHVLCPVMTIPYVIDIHTVTPTHRQDVGIPEEAFVFLFIFDFYSHMDRKNPLSTIRAFLQAFGDRNDVCLVFAVSHGSEHQGELAILLEASKKSKNIILIHRYFDHAELLGLMQSCNAYISLHRTESFGITIAEAMALGIKAIATDYGGSRDFLDSSTGYPVPYSLLKLEKDVGPYPAGAFWADADTEKTAEIMRSIVDNPASSQAISLNAKKVIQEKYSPYVVGTRMKKRLEHIGAL